VTCTTLVYDERIQACTAALDPELREALEEVWKLYGKKYYLTVYDHETRWLGIGPRRKSVKYNVLYHCGSIEYQILNFGPCEPNEEGWGHFVNRQTAYAFLCGLVNGHRKAAAERNKEEG
jgi:hypothetical protein